MRHSRSRKYVTESQLIKKFTVLYGTKSSSCSQEATTGVRSL